MKAILTQTRIIINTIGNQRPTRAGWQFSMLALIVAGLVGGCATRVADLPPASSAPTANPLPAISAKRPPRVGLAAGWWVPQGDLPMSV
jgi:hypothetical protein